MKLTVALAGLIAVGALVAALMASSAQEEEMGALSGRLDAVERSLEKIADRLADIAERPAPQPELLTTPRPKVEERLEALAKRIARLEQAEPATPPPGKGAKEPQETPAPATWGEANPAEVQRWIDKLDDEDEDVRFSATIELARLGSLEAVPSLMRYLDTDKDFYVRLGAATALGELRAADAVTMLIDHLEDKNDLVRTASAEALHRICKQDFDFVSGLAKAKRIEIQDKWRAWWRQNERAVRDRLRTWRAKRTER